MMSEYTTREALHLLTFTTAIETLIPRVTSLVATGARDLRRRCTTAIETLIPSVTSLVATCARDLRGQCTGIDEVSTTTKRW